jgi:hypothetical protein
VHIDLRDTDRKRIGRITVDPALRPTRVSLIGDDREVFLTWETALDDAGQLRRCVACGCNDVFREKAFPQVTGFVVVLAFTGAAVGVLGFANTLPVMAVLIAVLALDVAILLFARSRIVCYQCRTSYRGLPIARYHRTWDRAIAERYPAPETPPAASQVDRTPSAPAPVGQT